jgi:hypothetical protein
LLLLLLLINVFVDSLFDGCFPLTKHQASMRVGRRRDFLPLHVGAVG